MNTIEYWAGKDGDEYHQRQTVTDQANVRYFANALRNHDPASAIELGCGDGRNMKALLQLHPMMRFTGIDVNEGALQKASEYGRMVHGSVADPINAAMVPPHDLVYTKGVLIHIPPEHLEQAYSNIYHLSNHLILIGEYFSTEYQEVVYRGASGRLWKGPHAYDMLTRFDDLRLMDYGFHSRFDAYPQDDLNWWLLEKKV